MVSLLTQWRRSKAAEIDKPSFFVLTQKALMGVASLMPRNERELLAVPGIGKAKLEQYGKEILDIVANYREYNGLK